jgi:hypothetical protein
MDCTRRRNVVDWTKGVGVSAIDRRGSITSEHQARLDGLAAALTETVKQSILGDPVFVERLQEALHFRERAAALRIREELIHLLRAYEEAHDLPRSVPTKREAA